MHSKAKSPLMRVSGYNKVENLPCFNPRRSSFYGNSHRVPFTRCCTRWSCEPQHEFTTPVSVDSHALLTSCYGIAFRIVNGHDEGFSWAHVEDQQNDVHASSSGNGQLSVFGFVDANEGSGCSDGFSGWAFKAVSCFGSTFHSEFEWRRGWSKWNVEMSIVLGSTARCHGDCLQYSSVSAVDEFKAEAVSLNPFGPCYRYDGVGTLSYKL